MEDGEVDQRSAPLDWIASKMIFAVKTEPLCRDSYHLLQYKASRSVPFEDPSASKDVKAAREKALKEGKLAPEIFDKSFAGTPKAFYSDIERQIDDALGEIRGLKQACQEKFADASPGFGGLSDALTEVRQVVHTLLQKKRETEPDPVEEVPPETVARRWKERKPPLP